MVKGQYYLRVQFKKMNKKLKQSPRWATHPAIVAKNEKEARLDLLRWYNSKGFKVLRIENPSQRREEDLPF